MSQLLSFCPLVGGKSILHIVDGDGLPTEGKIDTRGIGVRIQRE